MHYNQFIVPKNIEIWNKVTQVILCHRKAAASIYKTYSVQCCQLYTRITIWMSARQIGQPVFCECSSRRISNID